MFIDTHTHLFTEQFDNDRKEVTARAIDAGVSLMLLPNIDVESIPAVKKLAAEFPVNCLPMMGLHPCSVDENWEVNLEIIREELFSGKYIAVGEIGIDLYWDKTWIQEQKIVFRKQIEWAKELKIPVAIHARDAFSEIFEILDDCYSEELSGVFHCFTGNELEAEKALSYSNFMLGIGGVVTYKKAQLDVVLSNIPLKRIILETDSPYLSPVPFRGKRNESSYLLHIAEKLAEIYSVPLKEVEKITTENAVSLFHLTI